MKLMHKQIRSFIFAGLLFSLALPAISQGLGGQRVPAAQTSEEFLFFDCGIKFPDPGRFTEASSVTHSGYRELGEGRINRFVSNVATFDIGCIDLDDPFRKLPRAALIAKLNVMTEAYLEDSLKLKALSAARSAGRDIYEFESKSGILRYLKYIFDGHRVFVFIAEVNTAENMKTALSLFGKVSNLPLRKLGEDSIASITVPSLPQSPALKTLQSDAALKNLKGPVKHVRREDVDLPAGTSERKIKSDETFDATGNLLKSYWILNNGFASSVRVYGFLDGKRISDSVEVAGGLGLGESISARQEAEAAKKPYEYRYEMRLDEQNRRVERLDYDNRDRLIWKYVYDYDGNWVVEKRFSTIELVSTTRRQLNKDGNEIKFEFWWYNQTDRVEESYEYKKFDANGNWTERRVVRKIIDRGLVRFRTSDEFRVITYHANR